MPCRMRLRVEGRSTTRMRKLLIILNSIAKEGEIKKVKLGIPPQHNFSTLSLDFDHKCCEEANTRVY